MELPLGHRDSKGRGCDLSTELSSIVTVTQLPLSSAAISPEATAQRLPVSE